MRHLGPRAAVHRLQLSDPSAAMGCGMGAFYLGAPLIGIAHLGNGVPVDVGPAPRSVIASARRVVALACRGDEGAVDLLTGLAAPDDVLPAARDVLLQARLLAAEAAVAEIVRKPAATSRLTPRVTSDGIRMNCASVQRTVMPASGASADALSMPPGAERAGERIPERAGRNPADLVVFCPRHAASRDRRRGLDWGSA